MSFHLKESSIQGFVKKLEETVSFENMKKCERIERFSKGIATILKNFSE